MQTKKDETNIHAPSGISTPHPSVSVVLDSKQLFFDPGSGQVGFVVDKMALGKFSPSTSVSPGNLHSTNCFTITLTCHLGRYNRPEVAVVQGSRVIGNMFLNTKYPVYSHLLKLVPNSRIFLPWSCRRYIPSKRRFTQDLHGATSQKTAFLIYVCQIWTLLRTR
jgi:hypothetical protein